MDAKNKGETGSYQLKVSVTAAAADSYALTAFDLSGCGTVVGRTGDSQGQLQGGCQGGLFPRQASESILRLSGLDSRVTLRASSDDFSPTLYALTGCGPLSSDFVCNSARNNAEARIEVDPKDGDAYVVVDGSLPGQALSAGLGESAELRRRNEKRRARSFARGVSVQGVRPRSHRPAPAVR